MNLNTLNLKIILALSYLIIITICLYSLFSVIDIKDLMSYEFIKSNKDIILKYKNENFLLLGIVFFVSSILWVLMLGFAMPLLLFSGFVFGKIVGNNYCAYFNNNRCYIIIFISQSIFLKI